MHKAFSLSKEHIAPQIVQRYGRESSAERTASEIAVTNVAKRVYQKEYMDYWNSTSQLTEPSDPVVAFLAPVAPFAAAKPKEYDYYGQQPSCHPKNYAVGY